MRQVCTTNGKTVTYSKGDICLIPAGALHQITLHPGYAEMDYVLNEDRSKGRDTTSQKGEAINEMRKINKDLKKGFELESQGVVCPPIIEPVLMREVSKEGDIS